MATLPCLPWAAATPPCGPSRKSSDAGPTTRRRRTQPPWLKRTWGTYSRWKKSFIFRGNRVLKRVFFFFFSQACGYHKFFKGVVFAAAGGEKVQKKLAFKFGLIFYYYCFFVPGGLSDFRSVLPLLALGHSGEPRRGLAVRLHTHKVSSRKSRNNCSE